MQEKFVDGIKNLLYWFEAATVMTINRILKIASNFRTHNSFAPARDMVEYFSRFLVVNDTHNIV